MTKFNFTLRDLPAPTRAVIGAFLIAIGIGYFSGLVQLHYQHATGGNLMPTAQDAVDIYHGATEQPISKIESLLTRTDGPFNGTGTMVPAFFEKSDRRWQAKLDAMSAEERDKLIKDREGEVEALLHWVRAGAPKADFEKDEHLLTKPIQLTEDFVTKEDGKTILAIQKLFTDRCIRCHMENGADQAAANYPLDNYGKIAKYVEVKGADPMDVKKLAQTTHVHLIGFTMMFTLTGLAFSLTAYPGWIRAIIAPLPLITQVLDIGCWWLARLDPTFAMVIMVTGGLTGLGLAIHIVGGLAHLTGLARPLERRPVGNENHVAA